MGARERREGRLIWVILLLGLSLRLISLDQSLWLDEAINVLAAKNYSFIDLITKYAVADFHAPGWFIILWFWGKLFGYSEIAVRLPSVIFGVITIYTTYLIGKKLVSRNLGLIAALLIGVNPLHIYYSQEARMYALATLAVSLNIFLLIKLVKREKFNLIFLIMSNIIVLASDYVAYFVFPAQLIFLLMLKQKEIIKKWVMSLLVAVLAGIWWVPIFLNQLDVGAVASANLPAWKFIVGGFDPKAVPLTFIKFIIGRVSLADKLIYGAILLPISILFSFLLWRAVIYIGGFERKLLISLILVPIILATFISLIVPIYSYFRLLFILPFFVLLIALGIISFKIKFKHTFLILVFLIFFFSSLAYLFNPAFQREDWRGLTNFLKSKNVLVLFESSGTFPPFDYYSKGNINTKGALKDFPARGMKDLANLEEITKNSKEIYLVEYLVDIFDPNRLVEKKLAELQFDKVETKDFHGVGFVYHFVKNE